MERWKIKMLGILNKSEMFPNGLRCYLKSSSQKENWRRLK